ncbi:MAG: DUF1284 domain-containing protein [Rickettsiaceae bacterium]|nr:DUF1284 domain-containing protein [Rickettsiaceae bacterium]
MPEEDNKNKIWPEKEQVTENTSNKVYFRPHHFMCTLSFKGKGYSLGFVRNYKKIHKQLCENEDTIIEVAEYMDDICHACPHKLDEVVCKSQEKILKLDKAHREILQLKDKENLTWRKAKERIKQHMTIEKFHQACDGCEWKKFGVCEKELKNLLKT